MNTHNNRKELPSEDPPSPTKYRPVVRVGKARSKRSCAKPTYHISSLSFFVSPLQHYDDRKFGRMPAPPVNSHKDIPMETKIWLSVFDDDPIGSPFRHEERST